MPWATDLLPHEIDVNMKKVLEDRLHKSSKQAVFVGTRGSGEFGNTNELDLFQKGCKPLGISLVCHSSTQINNDSAIQMIQNAHFAPTIVGTWQKAKG